MLTETIYNTLLGLDLFKDNIADSFVFNIPHSSINIPDLTGFNVDKINNEIIRLTDWETDKIFDVPNITRIVADFSRVFCDVERLPDDYEVMFKYGRGFFYTKTDDGNELRQNINNIKDSIFKNYYQTYHNKLNEIIDEKLKKHNIVYIVDCHSFTDIPFNTDLDKITPRPDICIGTDEYHTPKFLIDIVTNHFTTNGYLVKVNTPYAGTIVPSNHYHKNDKVKSIMIEINRKLYMDDNVLIIPRNIVKLNEVIKKLFT